MFHGFKTPFVKKAPHNEKSLFFYEKGPFFVKKAVYGAKRALFNQERARFNEKSHFVVKEKVFFL